MHCVLCREAYFGQEKCVPFVEGTNNFKISVIQKHEKTSAHQSLVNKTEAERKAAVKAGKCKKKSFEERESRPRFEHLFRTVYKIQKKKLALIKETSKKEKRTTERKRNRKRKHNQELELSGPHLTLTVLVSDESAPYQRSKTTDNELHQEHRIGVSSGNYQERGLLPSGFPGLHTTGERTHSHAYPSISPR